MNRRRLGLVLGVNQTLSWGMTFYLPAVIVAPAARDLEQSTVSLLGAFSAALLISGFRAPRVERWIDRHRGKGSIVASILVLALGLAIVAMSPNLAVWYLGWAVLGVGMAIGLYDAAFATWERYLGAKRDRASPESRCWRDSRAPSFGRTAPRSSGTPDGADCCCFISVSCRA